ncbi:MAG: hypothetical protein U1E81_06395 [Xanthobacteraceae bacterium]
MKIVCTNFRVFERNTLQGFTDLEIFDIGLTVRECTVHRKGDRWWIGLPGKPQIDKSGNVIRDPQSGKPAYVNILQFTGRSFADEFASDAITAIRKAFPNALSEGADA